MLTAIAVCVLCAHILLVAGLADHSSAVRKNAAATARFILMEPRPAVASVSPFKPQLVRTTASAGVPHRRPHERRASAGDSAPAQPPVAETLSREAPVPLSDAATAVGPQIETPASAKGALAPSANGEAITIPPPQRLHFAVVASRGAHAEHGEGEIVWRHDGSDYELTFRTQIASETSLQRSTGKLTADGLQPTVFAAGSVSPRAAQSSPPPHAVSPGTQDPLSALLQIASRFGGPLWSHAPGTVLVLESREPWGASITFIVEGFETLVLAGRAMQTVKLSSTSGTAGVKAEVWLAPEMAGMPVRLNIENDNGDLTAYEWTPEDLH